MNKMTFKFVNTAYFVINKNNEIYGVHSSFDDACDEANSYNRMKQTYANEIPFSVYVVDPDDKCVLN